MFLHFLRGCVLRCDSLLCSTPWKVLDFTHPDNWSFQSLLEYWLWAICALTVRLYMHMAEAHTCTLAPGGGASTLDTTDPPNCMEHIWARDSPTAPRSQSFPRRLRLKCQRETHLCNMQVHVQCPGSLFRRFGLRLLHWSHHTTEQATFAPKRLMLGREGAQR